MANYIHNVLNMIGYGLILGGGQKQKVGYAILLLTSMIMLLVKMMDLNIMI
ncbi:MAG: hypothetical protein KZQ94_05800 [Candidatus Thiodiazotropha sp. (ex Troendleina suluensis)]|nr:hypothetical protein [Candidatus Thiodiazotropha sp. (ex Troendleina suluensis)]